MKETPANAEGTLSLLDQTSILYGSSNSTTHTNLNYPLVLAGGKGLGFQHGSYHRFDQSTPLANLQFTMLKQAGISVESFAGSNGLMQEVLG